ncbi:hypothetical protein EDB19DRAFT_99812 [Suillus lakei]|nr:hypothetical protein EDB19DRAFT_99812 [Suillus lakei]
MSTSDFLLHNEPSHQWQNYVIPHPGPLSGPLPPMIPPPLPAGSSQISHGGTICPPLDLLPTDQPYLIPLHSHPPPLPLLLSCRWLCDNAFCRFTGTLEALKAHCKTCHFAGAPNAQIECHWEACDYHNRDDPTVHVMRRDCMWRHTREVHLGIKRGS